MKKIIIACGSGIATSTVATTKLKEEFEKRGILDKVTFIQTSLSELPSVVDSQDVIVTTAQGGDGFGIPVVSGLSLITGFGYDKTVDEIVSILGL